MTPPYFLRPNKTVDRFILIEILKNLFKLFNERSYTYYSMAGPFLEDAKLIHQHFPDLPLVSIEKDKEEFKRQKFHKFCSHIKLHEISLEDFLNKFNPRGCQIFWLDFTDLKYTNFTWFGNLLTLVNNNSIVRITLQCSIDDNKRILSLADTKEEKEKIKNEVKSKFEGNYLELISKTVTPELFFDEKEYKILLQEMIQIKAQKSLPTASNRIFQILHSSYYRDTTGMLSVTGIVTDLNNLPNIKKQYKSFPFSNLNWGSPQKIDIPVLSVQERLQIQKHLPSKKKVSTRYLNCLGYRIGYNDTKHTKMMELYSQFHAYYPYFVKVTI